MPLPEIEIRPGWASESEHWYWPDGRPAHTIVGANGKERPTTLRDARKFGFYPSVSKIKDVAARPGLERWKAEQLLMAALTLPRLESEPEASWIGRVWDDSKAQAAEAAKRGTAIHAAVEQYLRGDPYEPWTEPHIVATIRELERKIGPLTGVSAERSFASKLGFGGKVDLICQALIDFKTKEGDLVGEKIYDEHKMQLGAYAYGMGLDLPCGVCFISRTDPSAKLIMLEPVEVCRGWDMFMHLFRYWQAQTGYYPGA